MTFNTGSTLSLAFKTWLSMTQAPFMDGGMALRNKRADFPPFASGLNLTTTLVKYLVIMANEECGLDGRWGKSGKIQMRCQL